jgi:hypothetical protein
MTITELVNKKIHNPTLLTNVLSDVKQSNQIGVRAFKWKIDFLISQLARLNLKINLP